jgi:arylsulfatase A-like enzyme
MPPHQPYAAPEEIAEQFQGKLPTHRWRVPPALPEMAERNSVETADTPAPRDWDNYYDANLRWGDWCVGEILRGLEAEGRLDRTLVIVTADHGEALGEHGLAYHMHCPYDEALHIPLLMRFPGGQKPVGRVKALTQTVDLVPTLLELGQVPAGEAKFQGRSLMPLLACQVTEVNEFVFSRTAGSKAWYIVRDARGALMLHHGGKRRAYFDLEADPWQTRNVLAKRPEQAEELEKAFAEFAKGQTYRSQNFLDPKGKPAAPASVRPEMSEETRRKLKSLGYLR